MTIIDQQGLIGDLIPSVYISKILLESSGETLKTNNPHIDESKEQYELLELKRASSKSLKVTLNLVVKEKLSDNNIGSWYDKENISKYIDIKLFQITDQKLTDIISSGVDMIDIVDPSKNLDYYDVRYVYASYMYGTDDVQLISEKIKKHSQYKKVTLNKGKNLNNSIDEFKSYVDDAGNQIYDITYVLSFVLPTEKPQHLSYFAVSSFNLEELSKDYQIKLSPENLQNIPVKITSDTVIDDGQLVTRTYIFHDQDAKVWAGPVVLADNGTWYSGYNLDENSKPLIRSVVVNSKVRDNRSLNQLSINVESLYNKYLNNSAPKITTSNTIPNKKETYFSNLFTARGTNGSGKFMFAVNVDKLLYENSLHGNLLKSSSKLREEVLANSNIKSLIIYRQRVKQDGLNYNVFDVNEPIEYIVGSRDESPNVFKTVNNEKSAIRESFIVTNNNEQYIRYFTGIDKSISNITMGMYRYTAELEIEDGTIDFVEKQIELLLLAKLELEKYYETSLIPTPSKIELEIQNPHIEHKKETVGSKVYNSGFYDSISNQFTQEFDKFMKEKYPTQNLLLAPWISAPATYLSVLDVFTDIMDNVVEREKYIKDLHAAVSPSTGNPNGVMLLIKLINELISNLSKSINTSITISPRKFGNNSQKIASFSKSARETIKVKKVFSEIFDTEISKGYIYDYLSNGQDDTLNNDGLRVLTTQQFISRIKNEVLKHFDSTDDSININFSENNILINDNLESTSFTYLSPSRVDIRKKSYIFRRYSNPSSVAIEQNASGYTSEEEAATQIQQIQQSIASEVIFGISAAQYAANHILNIISNLNGLLATGLVVANSPERVLEEDSLFVDQTSSKIITKNKNNDNLNKEYEYAIKDNKLDSLFQYLVRYMSIGGGRRYEKGLIKKLGSMSPERFDFSKYGILENKNVNLRAYRDEIGKIIIEGFKKPLTEKEFKNLPNAIKKLFLRRQKNPSSPNAITQPKAKDEFDYSLLNKLEYLEGFEVNSFNEIIFENQIWKDLTKSDYQSKIGKEILCRMRNYEDSKVGTNRNTILNKPYYDQMFILLLPISADNQIDIKPVNIESKQITSQIIKSVELAIPGVKFVQIASDLIRGASVNISGRKTSRNINNLFQKRLQQNLMEQVVQQNVFGQNVDSMSVIQSISDLKSVPSSITIIEQDSSGKQISKRFELTDRSSIINAIKSLNKKTKIKLQSIEVQIPTKIVSQFIGLETQNSLINVELTSTNLVSTQRTVMLLKRLLQQFN